MNEEVREIMDEWYIEFCDSLPPRLQDMTIANYELTNADGTPRGDKTARQRVGEWAHAFPKVDRGLYLYGPTGVGKTHLAVGALKSVAYRYPTKVRYIHLSEYMERRRQRGIGERQPFNKAFRGANLLLLDEIGAMKATDFMAEQVYLLIDALWQDDKRIIVTSNQTFGELANLYGERTISRLVDLTERVPIEASDDRVQRARSKV